MAPQGEATLPATRRARKSIGGSVPSRRSGDKENATVDVGSAMAASRKKSRSKSMGPGGLDVLKMGTGNRRASLAVPSGPPPRSILKPTIPLIPEIPSYKPKSTPGNSNAGGEAAGTKVALRTEEEQQAAAREREERERAQLEKEISDRREARRKSLANRRVSFAAEATLHTFHEVEYNPDSTTSTNSTRRASSLAAQSSTPRHDEGPSSDPPSTPSDDGQDYASESPAHQRDLQQRKRRRSSAASSFYTDDDTFASTTYDSDLEHADGVAEVTNVEMTGSSDDEDGTMMTVDAEEVTLASVASGRSGFSADSTGSLDENLRLAARRAATQSLDDDEEEEVIAGFAGWGRKNHSQENSTQNVAEEDKALGSTADAEDRGSDMEMDMDVTNAVGGILHPQPGSPTRDIEADEDMSMDVTKVLGGILSKSDSQVRRKSVKPSAQQGQDEFGEQTMEFTTAVGGIRKGRISIGSLADPDGNEDMSMEFTAAIGGLLSTGIPRSAAQNSRRRTIAPETDDGDEATMMDMTVSVGRILPAEDELEDGDQTMGMDMTTAVGGIIRPESASEVRTAARKIMEQEANEPAPPVAASAEVVYPELPVPTMPDENASSGLSAFRGKGLRRSPPRAWPVATGSPDQPSSSPFKGTPSPQRNTTQTDRSPTRTPPSMVGSRSSSPMRNLSSPVKATPRSPSRPRLFLQDPSTGLSTPRIVLTPQGRRLSGVGADRPGLGSPRVAEIFDRRESIGEAATDFVPSQPANPRRTVAFTDPRVIEAEIDRERQDEHDKEDSRRILEREVNGPQDDRDMTLNLKEMIQGLSPKKNLLRGRKSLHVGSARGLLGKRPVELDDDDEGEETDGVKRLKGHQSSPVKNIRLQSPPSKAETTTGRKTRPSIMHAEPTNSDNITPTVASSPQRATTPRGQGRFRNVADDEPTNTVDFEHTAPVNDVEMQEGDEERIHLQDFLNMTSIRFMELTTTKRRHTIAPGAARDSTAAGGKDDLSLERCVSCRELKKYISEGRRIVREIETETFEENPPLFREYMTASPEFKVLMDNQFKNVKTHARLLSKAMWYEWRMKLQDGLKEGLLKTAEGMDDDDRLLKKQQELLSSVLPDMVKRFEALEIEHENLEAVARELADCDPKDLEDARAELAAVDKNIAEKTRKIEELRQQLDESVESIESCTKQKQQCLDEIREADKIREECRGWSSAEISKLKARTDALEKQHGWSITAIKGTAISMRYKREIELVFDTQQNVATELRYITPPDSYNNDTSPRGCCPPEKAFFLDCIRAHITQPSSLGISHLVKVVSSAWDKADSVSRHIRLLNLSFPTTVTRISETSLQITSSLLLAPLQTRVEAVVTLEVNGGGAEGVEVNVVPEARVVYGEGFNVGKMTEFLAGRVTGDAKAGWEEAVLGLYRKLLAKGVRAAA
ncbi:Spc7 kinetochore protein domain-containing protein [Madurella fahalii]|uniref:Spc7 kinetochore protein domain-containing protein n=1 Tax=Madurella fahalii TaxID=1157608 RepID=A0ABQ0FZZ4_9PEZI